MEEIRLGTIGTGVIVEQFLAQVVKTEGIRLVSVYSRSREKGEQLAHKYGAQQIHTDLDAFLTDDRINCVYIASPNSLHYPQTKKALLAGKHVWCEKPFCPTAAQARELAALAREPGLMLVEAVPTIFLPNLARILDNLSQIGRLRLVQGNYSQYSSRYDQLLAGGLPNVFNPEFAGGCLVDINYYNVYLTVALFGKPLSVQYYPNVHSAGADTSGILILTYPEFVCQLTGAKDTWYDNVYSIQGEWGFIQIPGGSNGLRQVRTVTRQKEETFNDQPDPDRLSYEVRALTNLFRWENFHAIQYYMDITIAVMEVLEAARHSADIRFPGE